MPKKTNHLVQDFLSQDHNIVFKTQSIALSFANSIVTVDFTYCHNFKLARLMLY